MVNVKVPKLNEQSRVKNDKLISEFKSSEFEHNNNINLIIKESDHVSKKPVVNSISSRLDQSISVL